MFVKEYPLVVRFDEVEIMCLHRIKDALDAIKHAVCDSPNSISSPSGTGTSPDGGASPLQDHVPFRRKENFRRSLVIANRAELGTMPVLSSLFRLSRKASAGTGKRPYGRPAACLPIGQTARCCPGNRCKRPSSVRSKRHLVRCASTVGRNRWRRRARRRTQYLRSIRRKT